jgi:hypothetical protein
VGLRDARGAQDNQNVILRNEQSHTSAAYRRFLLALGWEVGLAGWRVSALDACPRRTLPPGKVDLSKPFAGFSGGLDARSTGATSLYYCTATTEIMFHVATMMPTKPEDPQVCREHWPLRRSQARRAPVHCSRCRSRLPRWAFRAT